MSKPTCNIVIVLALAVSTLLAACGIDAQEEEVDPGSPLETAALAVAPGSGAGPTTGIRSCGTKCQDSFISCVRGGANWNVCNAIYQVCLSVCQGTNQPNSPLH